MKNWVLRVALAAMLAGCGETLIAPDASQAHATGETASRRTVGEIIAEASADDWIEYDQDNLLYIELEHGVVIVALSTYLAQAHGDQLRLLARERFYDGLSFYRVIEGFVAQAGDPFEERPVGSAQEALIAQFEQEYTSELPFHSMKDQDGFADAVGFLGGLPAGRDVDDGTIWHLHCTGAFAFGRSNARDSASTEIYINLQPHRYLDRNLSVVGRVVSGMEHVQALRRVHPPQSKEDDIGDAILSVRIGADLPPERRQRLRRLKTDTATFAEFIEARRNRRSDFFHFRHDYADICQLPFPIESVE